MTGRRFELPHVEWPDAALCVAVVFLAYISSPIVLWIARAVWEGDRAVLTQPWSDLVTGLRK